MRIEQLYLKNFRGFEEITIDFPKGNICVLIGRNGAGKSSVLDGVGIALAGILLSLFDFEIEQDEIITLNASSFFKYSDIKVGTTNAILKIKVNKEGIIKEKIIEKTLSSSAVYHSRKILKLDKVVESNFKSNIPFFTYYLSNRDANYLTDRQDHITNKISTRYSQFEAFELRDDALDFKRFYSWFIRMVDTENHEKIERKALDYTLPELDVVRKALEYFFKKLEEKNNYQELRVIRKKETEKYSTNYSVPHIVFTKNDEKLSISQLSDGEKMLLMIVADIARRLSIANPSLENPLEGKGIVLIDEIELHLHPGWQRNVLPALTATFPNIQFIVTTHSPQVLGAIDKESILILEDFKVVENTPHTKGRDSNSILFELFGVEKRDKEAQAKLDKLYDLIENDDKVEAMKLLDDIKKSSGEQDIEVTRANMYLDLMDEVEEEGE